MSAPRNFCLVLLLVFAAVPAVAETDSDGIRAAARDWIEAFTAGDIDSLMALYDPDAFVALHGQPAMRGRPAIRAYFAPKLGIADVDFQLEFEEIEIHGEVAHLVSKYWYTSRAIKTGELYQDAGRSALIYKRSPSGQWRIYLDIDQATPDVSFPAPD